MRRDWEEMAVSTSIEILFLAGCPNFRPTVELAERVVVHLGVDAHIQPVVVDSADEAVRRRFLGSPSIHVNGQDIEPDAESRSDFTVSCRLYGGSGIPSRDLLESAVRAAVA